MKTVIVVLGLMFANVLFAQGVENQRYVITSSNLMIQGEQIPVTLLLDSQTGETWYVGLVGEGPRAVPMWQHVIYYPGNTTTPPSSKAAYPSGGQSGTTQ